MRRWLPAAILAVLVLRLMIALPGWYAGDDATFKLEAWTASFVDTVQRAHFGNLMPAALAIEWFRIRIWPGYESAAVILLLAFAASTWLMWVLLGRLGLSGGARAAGVGFFVLTPLTAEVTLWWATGMNNTLYLPFVLAALISALQYARTEQWRWLITGSLCQLAALSFFQKGVLVPLWILCVGLMVPTLQRRLRRPVLAATALSAVYLVVYVTVVSNESLRGSGVPAIDEVLQVALGSAGKSVLATIAGGPWLFVSESGPSAVSTPWFLLVPVVALAVVGVARLTPQMRWRVPLMLGVWLLADAILVFYGRSGEGSQRVLGTTDWTRYVADLAIPMSIAVAAIAERLARRTLTVIAAIFVVSAAVAWTNAARVWWANPAREWTARAETSIGTAATPLLSQSVPEPVNPPDWGPAAAAQGYLAGQVPDDTWTDTSAGTVGLTVDGLLGDSFESSVAMSTVGGCGTEIVIPLNSEVPDGSWIMRTELRSEAPQDVTLRLDVWVSGTTTIPVAAGSSVVYSSLRGTGTQMLVTAPEQVCVDRLSLGRITD
jgi:hypothetical protein